jgi:ribosomal protein S18 acetylase RimI-like enzyme
VDGGRLKLEWGTLRSRPEDQVNDLLWHGEGGIVGFLGIYGYRPDQVELCGMVHPAARRQGVFSALFEAAMAEVGGRGVPQALLVVDRGYEAGAAFARSVGGAIEHSEHRMTLRREPAPITADPLISIREAEVGDGPFIVDCLGRAFDIPAAQFAKEVDEHGFEALMQRFSGTLLIDYANEPVGTVRVDRDRDLDAAGIYGFAVLPDFQGRGIGRQVLSSLARQLSSEGLTSVSLEVSVTNDAALHLYSSCGFDVMGTEDYHAVAVAPVARP